MDVSYEYREQRFIWDENKAISNVGKHFVAFEAACEVFFDSDSIYVDATDGDERRSAVIGITTQARLLMVVHLAKEKDGIRIISARKAT